MTEPLLLVLLPAAAGFVGGVMNALAGGGTFATLPALIAIGHPALVANANSNVALLPAASLSAWLYRDELAPMEGLTPRTLAAVTFAGGIVGGVALLITPSRLFDVIVPWLLLFAFFVLLFGRSASAWLRARVTIGGRALFAAQIMLGIYGGYFGGGVGMITTALYGLLAGATPREMFALRTLMLATANLAAAFVFITFGLVRWTALAPMIAGALTGGWVGAIVGKRLNPLAVRFWTLIVTAATTIVFFQRAYW